MVEASDHGVARAADGKWLPGQSPNPGGRPKGISLASVLVDELSVRDARKIIRAMFKRAKAGDVRAFEALIERTDGKVPTRIAGILDDEGAEQPIPLRIISDKP